MENSEIESGFTEGESPDLILLNGKILSPNSEVPSKGWLKLAGGIIESSGRGDFPHHMKGRDETMVDLKGSLVIPAMFDAHMHLYQWSFSKAAVDLSHARSKTGIIKLLKMRLDQPESDPFLEGCGVLLGVDFDESTFENPDSMNGDFLESAFSDQPVIIRRICGHKAILNKSAEDLLGKDINETQDGVILEEEAMKLIWDLGIDDRYKSKLVENSIRKMYSLGLIGGVDIIPANILKQHKRIFERIGLPFDIVVSVNGNIRNIPRRSIPHTWNSEMIKDEWDFTNVPTFSKFFMDGSIGAGSASFMENGGNLDLHTEDEISDLMDSSHKMGLIPMVHAIGDHAISTLLDAIDTLNGPVRIEHAESVSRKDMGRLHDPRIAVCMQPNFQRVWGGTNGLYDQVLGQKRLGLNRFSDMIRSCQNLCFGSDMMPPGPIFGIHGALNHGDPLQSISFVKAVDLYSREAIRLSGIQRKGLGLIEEGSPANIAVIDSDDHIVKLTIKEGSVVYRTAGLTK
jgi:hypothetical protein